MKINTGFRQKIRGLTTTHERLEATMFGKIYKLQTFVANKALRSISKVTPWMRYNPVSWYEVFSVQNSANPLLIATQLETLYTEAPDKWLFLMELVRYLDRKFSTEDKRENIATIQIGQKCVHELIQEEYIKSKEGKDADIASLNLIMPFYMSMILDEENEEPKISTPDVTTEGATDEFMAMQTETRTPIIPQLPTPDTGN